MTWQSVLLTMVSLIVGFGLNLLAMRMSQPKIRSSRQRILKGAWNGKFKQEANENRESKEFLLKIELDPGKRMIIGKMWVTDKINFECTLEGTFHHDQYLRLHYSPTGNNKDFIDFGSILLAVSKTGTEMNGRVMGYGSISEAFISGTLKLTKDDEKIVPRLARPPRVKSK
ncbi:hypothetical protein [Candidatus Nitrospira salsa]